MSHDVIEREIFIKAGIERVWSLVSKAGFWVGDELTFEHSAQEGETVTIETERWGNFPVVVETLDAPRYAAYRWASGFAGQEPTSENSTLVEFTLIEQDGGVNVQMKESGFAAIPNGEKEYRDNDEGWPLQLKLLQTAAEGAPVT
jgi:uncharacterized protein YndB with AHSA1/START domain